MKKKIKTDKCLNCGYQLTEAYDYCPKCGQENSDKQLSFKQLLQEFFANYFSFDSRFGRSIKPFFLQPGQLTHEFMIGKRVSYANPIRLYLVISLLHFFILSVNTSNLLADSNENTKIFTASESSELGEKITLDSVFIEPDSISGDSIKATASEVSINRSEEFIMSDEEWETLIKMAGEDFTIAQIQDSLGINEKPFFEKHITTQFIKIQKSDANSINAYLLKNIPILMFFLLPLYALVLKLFFRKKLYINHIIHSLHLHSFLFTILTFYWLIELIFGRELPTLVNAAVFIALTLYTILSFKNVYEKTFWKSLFKVLSTGAVYLVILLVGILLEIFLSLLFY